MPAINYLHAFGAQNPAPRNFFTGLDKVAQPLMEAFFVDFTGSSLART